MIAVDSFGQPADYDELEALTRRHGLFLIEDAACSAGSTYRGGAAGSFGVAAVFSLHGRKGITSGEGGIVTTADGELAERVRRLSSFGIEPAFARQDSDEMPIPQFRELGFNYKLSDIQAAVAGVQLARIDELLDARRRVAAGYRELLADTEHMTLPAELDDRRTCWQSFVVEVQPPLRRDRIALLLRQGGVQANIGTYASHLLPVYDSDASCPVSAGLFRRHLAIPMHSELTDGQIERVSHAVRSAVEQELEDVVHQ